MIAPENRRTPAARRPHPPALEALEGRSMLAAYLYHDFLGFYGLSEPNPALPLEGASEDGRYIWSAFFLMTDGVPVATSDIPGLLAPPPGDDASPRSTISGVTPGGDIVFYNSIHNPTPTFRSQLFIIHDGAAATLASTVQQVVGGHTPAYDDFNLVKAGPGGHLLIQQGTPGDGAAWVLHEGVLTFLWDGEASDINSAGVAVGNRRVGDQTRAVMWSAAGGVATIPALSRAGLINNLGDVLGVLADPRGRVYPGNLATWNNGVVVDFSDPGDRSIPNLPSYATWVFRDFDDRGRFLLAWTFSLYGGPYVTPIDLGGTDGTYTTLGDATHGYPTDVYFAGMVLFDDGRILAHAVLTPIADAELAVLREGSSLVSASTGDGLYVAGVNQYNELFAMRSVGDSWTFRRLRYPVAAGPLTMAIFADPRNGHEFGDLPFIVVSSESEGVQLFAAGETNHGGPAEVARIDQGLGGTPIVSRLTVFTNADGVVHITGLDSAGDLVMYVRGGTHYSTNPQAWYFVNLSQSHLAPQGLVAPGVASDMAPYMTAWNGMNVAWLDTDGHVQVLWWAPGMTLWRVDDLSASSGAAPLHGKLTAFVTPWNTLHVNGIDDSGQPLALWWAPGFGDQWRKDGLVDGSAVVLDPASLASYVTEWGGLNIVGIDQATRRAALYWWSPDSNGWHAELFTLVSNGEPVADARARMTGALAAGAGPEPTTLNVFGRGEDGHTLRLSWTPGSGSTWTLEELGMLL